jgi:hypothetical protein
MWVILGVIGSIAMAVIEATGMTDIGYLWSLAPTVVGIVLQIGGAEIIEGIFD